MTIAIIADLVPGMKVAGTVHSCAHCSVEFIGRADARFCSALCRVASSRAAKTRVDQASGGTR